MIEIRSDEELFEILTDNPDADILFADVYGYITEECSMLEENFPGIVNLTKNIHKLDIPGGVGILIQKYNSNEKVFIAIRSE